MTAGDNQFTNILQAITNGVAAQEAEKLAKILEDLEFITRDADGNIDTLVKKKGSIQDLFAQVSSLKGKMSSRDSLKAMIDLAKATGHTGDEVKRLKEQYKEINDKIEDTKKQLRGVDSKTLKQLGIEAKDIEGKFARVVRYLKDTNKHYEELKENHLVLGLALKGLEKAGQTAASGVRQIYSSVLSLLGLGSGIASFFQLFKEGYTENRRLGRSYIEMAANLGMLGTKSGQAFGTDKQAMLTKMIDGIGEFKDSIGLTREESIKVFESLGKEGIGKPLVDQSEIDKLHNIAGVFLALRGVDPSKTFEFTHQAMRRFGLSANQAGWQINRLSELSSEIGMDMSAYMGEVSNLSQAFEDQSISALGVAEAFNKIYNSSYGAQYGLKMTVRDAGKVVSAIQKLTAPTQLTAPELMRARAAGYGGTIEGVGKMQADKAAGVNLEKIATSGFKVLQDLGAYEDKNLAHALVLLSNNIMEGLLPGVDLKDPRFLQNMFGSGGSPTAAFESLRGLIAIGATALGGGKGGEGKDFDPLKDKGLKPLLDLRKLLGLDEFQKIVDDFFINVVKQSKPLFDQLKTWFLSLLRYFNISGSSLIKLGLALPIALGAAASLISILVIGIQHASKLAILGMAAIKAAAVGGGWKAKLAAAGVDMAIIGAINYATNSAGDAVTAAVEGKEFKGWDLKRAAYSLGPGLLAGAGNLIGPTWGAVGGFAAGAITAGNIASTAKSSADKISQKITGAMSGYNDELQRATGALNKTTVDMDQAAAELENSNYSKSLHDSIKKYIDSLRKLSEELNKSTKATDETTQYLGTGTEQSSQQGSGSGNSQAQPPQPAVGTQSGGGGAGGMIQEFSYMSPPPPLSSQRSQTPIPLRSFESPREATGKESVIDRFAQLSFNSRNNQRSKMSPEMFFNNNEGGMSYTAISRNNPVFNSDRYSFDLKSPKVQVGEIHLMFPQGSQSKVEKIVLEKNPSSKIRAIKKGIG